MEIYINKLNTVCFEVKIRPFRYGNKLYTLDNNLHLIFC